MKSKMTVLAIGVLIGTFASGDELEPWPVNPYKGMQEREDVFEFVGKPKVEKKDDKWTITFASKGSCDATVSIVDPSTGSGQAGRVVRHLASGVLGPNAPWPFKQGSLSQSIEWDGKDDSGKPAPAGCRVRIGLGLDARFESLDTWKLMSGIRPLAFDNEGRLYALTQGRLTPSIHAFGADGKYIRTILPPPAILADDGRTTLDPARYTHISWNRTAGGEAVPRRYRFGGGWDFSLLRESDFSIKSATVTADGKLCLLLASDRFGKPSEAKLLMFDIRDGACPGNDVVSLGKIVLRGMAPSPDGKRIYLSGGMAVIDRWKKKYGAVNHSVMTVSLEKPGAPSVFAGKPAEPGGDNAHLNNPTAVACDKKGNVYVMDSGNSRIQVFSPSGGHLKTIATASGRQRLMGVSRDNGAIFLWAQVKWSRNPVITKLGGLDNPAKVAEMTVRPTWQGTEWREGKQSALLSSGASPPRICFAGTAYRGQPLIVAVEDRGDSLATVADLLKANDLPNAGGDVESPGMWTSLHVDRRANEVRWGPVDPNGMLYRRAAFWEKQPQDMAQNKMWVVRFDPKAKKYVSFTRGDPACAPGSFLKSYRALVQDGTPVIGLPMYYARGAHHHQGPFCVAPNGDVYVGATYAKQTDAELEKAGLPRLKKGIPAICAPVLRVYGADGTLKSPGALPGLAELEGLRVGRSGSVYVVQPWKPLGQKAPDGLAKGSTYEDSRWASLIKFPGDFRKFPVGRIVGAWETSPSNPTHQGAGMKVRIEGALWTYGGVSPHSAKYKSCTCLKASADLDGYERSWVCAAQTCTVNAIDSNGNVIARLGGYGNADSRGEDSPVPDPKTGELRPRRPDDPKDLKSPLRPLGFCVPRNVAASDDTMWVVDMSHRALVRARLVYKAEEEVALP